MCNTCLKGPEDSRFTFESCIIALWYWMLRHVEELYGLAFHLCGFMEYKSPFVDVCNAPRWQKENMWFDKLGFALNLFLPCGLVSRVHPHPLWHLCGPKNIAFNKLFSMILALNMTTGVDTFMPGSPGCPGVPGGQEFGHYTPLKSKTKC